MTTSEQQTGSLIDQGLLGPAVDRAMRAARIPGLSVAVTDREGSVFEGGYGLRDRSSSAAALASTRYRWFSMTKLMTATAALQLHDQGILDINEPARDHLAAWPAGNVATIGQLLSHTAGLANPLPLAWVHRVGARGPDPSRMLDELLQRRGAVRGRPGGAARYSNVGFLAAAQIIAQSMGTSFTDHIRSRLLAPLGMSSTGFSHPKAEAAVGYLNLPSAVVPVVSSLVPTGIVGERHDGVSALNPFLVDGAGYGGLIGPATDAARFLRLHLGDGELEGMRLLEPATARRMRDQVSRGRSFDHAMGWFRDRSRGQRRGAHWEHYGTGAGFWNLARLYPDRGLGIVLMSNGTRRFDVNGICDAIVKGYRGRGS